MRQEDREMASQSCEDRGLDSFQEEKQSVGAGRCLN